MASPRGPRRTEATSARSSRHRKSLPRQDASARRRSPGVFIALILLAGGAAYWNSLDGPFIWDDQTAIVTNQSIHTPWTAWSPPRETPVAGRPVVNASFALNYAVGGLEVAGYHLVNIAVHLACALLLFGIVRRTLQELQDTRAGLARNTASSTAFRAVSPDMTALAATLLWTVHPIQSDAVDYLTQRTESMMGLFFFLTLYCAIRGRQSANHRGRWDAAAIVSCALGMASKETMVTAPLVVLLYDYVFGSRSVEALRTRTRLYVGLTATWFVLGILMWQAARSTVGVTSVGASWTYLLNQAQIVTEYLWLTVWPRALVLDYGLPRTIALGDVAPQALLIVTLAAASIISFARWPTIGFLPVTFFLTLAPTSSVVPILTEVGAERRMYVPSAALVVLVVVIGAYLLQRLIGHSPGRSRPIMAGASALLAVVVVALAVRTMRRNQEYASPLTLWRTVVARHPHGRAHYSLGTALVEAGQHDEAMAELYQAVADFPDARYALGTELFASGHVQESVVMLQEFIRAHPMRPDRLPARLLLGHVFVAEEKLDDAEREFRTLVEADRSNAGAQEGLTVVGRAHRDMAAKLLGEQNAGAAKVHAQEAVRLLPQDAAARNLLGVALTSTGDFEEGIVQFQRALELNPSDQQARNNLARALGPLRPDRQPR